MFRSICIGFAATVMISMMAGLRPAAAQTCQDYYNQAQLAATRADLKAMETLRSQINNSMQCSEVQKTCFAYLVADTYASQANELDSRGAPKREVEALATTAASIARTWTVLWTLASIEESKKNYEKAALYYKSTLNELKEVENRVGTQKAGRGSYVCAGEEAGLPTRKQTSDLIRLAAQADALSPTFVSSPPTRDGAPGGIFVGSIRGIEVTSHPIPVEFKFDSIEATPKGADATKALVDFINQDKATKIVLTGHTDQKGTDEYNCQLSKQRLDAVVALVKRNLRRNVVIEAIPQGKGERFEIVESSNLAQDQIDQVNRRIELRDRPELIVRKCP